MLTIRSHVSVPGLSAAEVTDFLAECTDTGYQQWWPGIHLHLRHRSADAARQVGDEVYMDEFIGRRHVRMSGVVVRFERARRIVWQMKRGVLLPVWLTVEVRDEEDGVQVDHTITAGYARAGRLLDPLLRLYFSPAFAAAMDEHVRTEFPLIRDRLHPAAG